MALPKINQNIRFTKATAQRNLNMLRGLKYFEENEYVSSEDIAVYLNVSSTTGRMFITGYLDLGLITFSHHDTSHVTSGHGIRTYRIIEGAYDKALRLLPTNWNGGSLPDVMARPDGQHLMADDYRAPQRLTVVRPYRDPLVTCIHGSGRAPSLNFTDSADGG